MCVYVCMYVCMYVGCMYIRIQKHLCKPDLPSEQDISRADEWDGFGGGDRGVHHAEEEQRRDIANLDMYVCINICI